eukprot:gene3722-4291_t
MYKHKPDLSESGIIEEKKEPGLAGAAAPNAAAAAAAAAKKRRYEPRPVNPKTIPWRMEDSDGTHQFQGMIEGNQASSYFLFMFQSDGSIKAVPCADWYTFRLRKDIDALSIEEAEAFMSKKNKETSKVPRGGRPGEDKSKQSTTQEDGDDHEDSEFRKEIYEDKDKFKAFAGSKKPKRGKDGEEEEEGEGGEDEDAPDFEAEEELENENLTATGLEMKNLLKTQMGKQISDDEDSGEDEKPDDDDDEEEEPDEDDDFIKNLPRRYPKNLDANGKDPADIKSPPSPQQPSSPSQAKTPVASKKKAAAKPKIGSPPDNSTAKRGAATKNKADSSPSSSVPTKKLKTESSQSPPTSPPTSPSVNSEEPLTEESIRRILTREQKIKTIDLINMFRTQLKSEQKKKEFKLYTNNLAVIITEGDQIELALSEAIKCGYLHIDTAVAYQNEEAIGYALKGLFGSGLVKREDLFIVSKAATKEHGYDNALQAYDNSLKRLGLDYLDCYLIHWPGVAGIDHASPENSALRKETWRAFEKLYADKKVRSIGVSNYTVKHLEELFQHATVKPHVNQVECHPFLQQRELLALCQANEIALEAFASLYRANKDMFEDDTIVSVAKSLGKTVSQILLRWAVQKNIMVIPKSTQSDRIHENAGLYDFVIPDDAMAKIDALDCGKPDIESSVSEAVKCGYLHIDTAASYKNEEAIGKTLKGLFDSGKAKREDLFIVSKAATMEHGYDNALQACDNSLKRLGLDYLDCYLIHWPGVAGNQPSAPENSVTRKETWRAFEKLYADKKCRSIGVSNYTVKHLEELFQHATVKPHVNQVEFHPFLYQKGLLEFCQTNQIALEAYASLTRANKECFEDETIASIAKSLGKTGAQVLLRWALQKNIIVIPKSTKTERIHENAGLYDFVIPDDVMAKIDALDCNKRICWDPNTVL